MSHGYSIYFTTKSGMFMGQWAIQEHFTKEKIEDIKNDSPNAFIGTFYHLKDTYSAIEVNVYRNIWYKDNWDTAYPQDILDGVKYALKEGLRMFLG